MIADLLILILVALSFAMIGWQFYDLGFSDGKRAGRREAQAENKTPFNSQKL